MWPTQPVLNWLQQILNERFGVSLTLLFQDNQVRIVVPGSESFIAIACDSESFSSAHSNLPCAHWNSESEGWRSRLRSSLPAPGVQNLPQPLIQSIDHGHYIGYDILGLTYWMLSRQEEVERTDLDSHGRFSATSSHAFKHAYLERPVVDEWLDILSQVIKKTWPTLNLKSPLFRMNVTCDVDTPYLFYTRGLPQTFKVVIGDLFKRKSVSEAFLNMRRYILKRRNDFSLDPFWQGVEWIMDVNEKIGHKVAFYFIAEHLDPYYDRYYPLDEKPLQLMLKEIVSRGHEIGLHPSYRTYQDAQQTAREAELLRQALQVVGSNQDEIGGRQHYLRWSVATTPSNWVAANMSYDSSLGYADRPGFRCGTCFEFPMFDPVAGKSLPLRQRPLIMMEGTVMSDAYLGLGCSEAALEKMLKLKGICSLFGGQYTILWHNSSLGTEAERRMYLQVIQ